MAKVNIEGAGQFHFHHPRLAAIVTTHARGRDNAMAVVWHSPLSVKPPLYGVSISPRRFTFELLLESKEFGVNFLPFEKAELVASTGGSEGRSVDKFERFHIARDKPAKTKVPLLKDAYASYECKLIDHTTYGDHEWLVGEIVAVHFQEEAFTAEGILDIAVWNPVLYLGAESYVTTLESSRRYLDRQIYGKQASS